MILTPKTSIFTIQSLIFVDIIIMGEKFLNQKEINHDEASWFTDNFFEF